MKSLLKTSTKSRCAFSLASYIMFTYSFLPIFMKKLLASLAVVSALAPSMAFAADFSTVLGVEKELKIVSRVQDKSIFTDIRRVQSYDVFNVVDGVPVTTRETNEQAVTANSDIVISVCQSVRALLGLSTSVCGSPTAGRTRQ